MKEWADKYKGKFDDGWEAYRERTYNPYSGTFF
jgi:arylsulfatase